MRRELIHGELTAAIIRAFYDVYNELGFGFLESIYARGLEILLCERGFAVSRESAVPVFFRGEQIGHHRCDMIVNGTVIVEIKSCEFLAETHKEQLRNYLTALSEEVGLLLHFGRKAHFHRIIGPQQNDQSNSVQIR